MNEKNLSNTPHKEHVPNEIILQLYKDKTINEKLNKNTINEIINYPIKEITEKIKENKKAKRHFASYQEQNYGDTNFLDEKRSKKE